MATLNNLPSKQLYDHLVSGGFLNVGFTDIFGNPQPAPVFQSFELNLARKSPATPNGVTANDRVVMIRQTGTIDSVNRIHMKTINMLLIVVGQVGDVDSIIAKGYMDDIENWLVGNFNSACISNIEQSGSNGPFITEDGRRAYELNMTVTFNI